MSEAANIKRAWSRKFWIFGIMYVVGLALILAMSWRLLDHSGRVIAMTMLGLAGFLVLGVAAFFKSYLDKLLILPLIALTRDYQSQKLLGAQIDADSYNGTMISTLVRTFQAKPASGTVAHSSETHLAEVLNLIEQSIIIVDTSFRVLLINKRAREMFQNQAGLGIGRDLEQLFVTDALRAAKFRMERDPEVNSERILLRRNGTGTVMPARVSLLNDETMNCLGYVIGFHEMTNALFQMHDLEREFENLIIQGRNFAALAGLAAHNFGHQTLEKEAHKFGEFIFESQKISNKMMGNAWPKSRINLRVLASIFRDGIEGLEVNEPEVGVLVRADASSLLAMLRLVFQAIKQSGIESPKLSFSVSKDKVKVKIYVGQKLDLQLIDTVMRRALTELPTAPSGDEILRYHGTEIWPHQDDDELNFVFELSRITTALASSVARPEFYEFQLPQVAATFADMRLRDMSVVVFDSETTGLDPKGGDKVVQISAVRVLAGKMLGAETFDELVNPERPIPVASTRIHGISNDMIMGKPNFATLLPKFDEYCQGDVLLAHNAAFDMAFLSAGARQANIDFNQPVLDTVFMSAFLFDHTGKHTLDDLCKRLGVTIPQSKRHTALGDAIATAEVFVRLIPLLEARGVETLGQMLEIGAQMHKIRKAQAIYS